MPRPKTPAHGPCPEQPDAEFMSVWIDYPNGNGRKPAWRAWWKARPTFTIEELTAALAWQKLSDQWRRGFVPMFATYLNQERWKDRAPRALEPTPPRSSMGPIVQFEPSPEQVRAVLADSKLRSMIEIELTATVAPYATRVTATQLSKMRETGRESIARRYSERYRTVIERAAPLSLVADI